MLVKWRRVDAQEALAACLLLPNRVLDEESMTHCQMLLGCCCSCAHTAQRKVLPLCRRRLIVRHHPPGQRL